MAGFHRILGVDDNPRNLAILRKALAGEFEFATAASGEEALAVAPGLRPDLILLDIMMPGLDGYETCRRLRACPELSSTKIIMVSARAMISERLEGYAAGADDYVVKPFDQDEMLAKVRVYLRLRSVEELDRLKSDLLGLLSHETRTPLTAIMSPIAMLLEEPGLTTEQAELLTLSQSGANRLFELFKKVSFLAQLKSGKMPFQWGEHALADIAGAGTSRARAKANSAGVRIECETEPAPLTEMDPELVRWVVEALLDNAIRFSPRGGVVRLRIGSTGSGSSLTVSDQGPGIPAELLPRVFEEFAVADVRHHHEGLGLSLSTAREIVAQHRGTLTVDCQSSGGTTFRMDLPASANARAAA